MNLKKKEIIEKEKLLRVPFPIVRHITPVYHNIVLMHISTASATEFPASGSS
jgi:hypothetical protein